MPKNPVNKWPQIRISPAIMKKIRASARIEKRTAPSEIEHALTLYYRQCPIKK